MKAVKLLMIGLLALVMLAGFVAGCSNEAPSTDTPGTTPAESSQPEVKPMTFTLVVWNATADDQQIQGWATIEEIEKRTNGLIKFDYRGGLEVIPEKEQTEAVRTGVIDCAWTIGSYGAGITPLANAFGLCKLTGPEMRASGVLDVYREAFAKQNIYFVENLDGSGYHEIYRVWTNFEIDDPDDIKGQKIRTTPNYEALVKYFGGMPVAIPAPDTYSALETGLVSGMVYPAIGPFMDRGFPEVIEYMVSPGFGSEQNIWLFNQDSWNSIPADLQKTFTEACADIEKEYMDEMLETHAKWVKNILAAGVTEVTLSQDAGERLQAGYYAALWDQIVADDPELGPKLRELME